MSPSMIEKLNLRMHGQLYVRSKKAPRTQRYAQADGGDADAQGCQSVRVFDWRLLGNPLKNRP